MRGLRSLVVIGSIVAAAQLVWAKHDTIEREVVDPDATYSITYQVTTEKVQTLEPVEVRDVVTFGSRSFLLVKLKGFGNKKAYLDLGAVRTIIQQ